jgi:hypothetical protein
VADGWWGEGSASVADRGLLPDWSDRTPRNPGLLEAQRDEVLAAMPAWELPSRPRRRRGIIGWLRGGPR